MTQFHEGQEVEVFKPAKFLKRSRIPNFENRWCKAIVTSNLTTKKILVEIPSMGVREIFNVDNIRAVRS